MTWNVTSSDMTVDTLALLAKEKRLQLRPRYQRELEWNRATDKRLIWCMIRGQDIPKIYLHIRPGKRGSTSYDVIDGQQRLNAIFRFLNDEFPLSTGAADIDNTRVAGKKFSQLPEIFQNRFVSYHITAALVESDDISRIIEQFLDLQGGRPLTAQQKREAYPSAIDDAVRRLAEHPLCHFVRHGGGKKLANIRMWVARLIIFEMADHIVDSGEKLMNRLYLTSSFGLLTLEEISRAEKSVSSHMDVVYSIFNMSRPMYSAIGTNLYWLVREYIKEGVSILDHTDEIRAWYQKFSEDTQTKDPVFWSQSTNNLKAIQNRHAAMRTEVDEIIFRSQNVAPRGITHKTKDWSSSINVRSR